MPPPKDPIKYEKWLNNLRNSLKKSWSDPILREKASISAKKRFSNIENRIKNGILVKKKFEEIGEGERISKRQIERFKDAAAVKVASDAQKKRFLNIDERLKSSIAAKKRFLDPEERKKASERSKNTYAKNEELRHNASIKSKKQFEDPLMRKKTSDAQKKRFSDPLERNKASKRQTARLEDPLKWLSWYESKIGGFWYGNIKYKDWEYCNLWNRNLFKRIDLFQEYKSIISGITQEENGGRALDRHHVYWQKKACCEWDEDTQGYFAMIDIGTPSKPNMYKYYIRGDPNKFVLLTRSEHGMISKDKLKWIKFFEDKIEDEWNGKCYYTKEEFKKITIST